VLAAAVGAGGYYVWDSGVLRAEPFPNATQGSELDVDWCTPVRIVTASSFRPVLTDIEPLLVSDDVCVQLDVQVANGLDAMAEVAGSGAHVWIPDDASWAGAADQLTLDPEAQGAGTVVATSPLYMVTDETTAAQISDIGGGWLDVANALSGGASGLTLVIEEPERSGDGMVAAGSVAESVWLAAGMDASAQALTAALPSIRTVEAGAMPEESGEIGIMPEYALVGLSGSGPDGASALGGAVLLPGTDHIATLRYTWLPTALGTDDPDVAAALERVLDVLRGSEADDARAAAGLRGPDMTPAPVAGDAFPPLEGEPFDVFSAHAVDHIFAMFYPEFRLADVYLAIDISGSMAAPPPGSDVPVLDLVKQGLQEMTDLLPDDSRVGLWQFGTQLDPPNDWLPLVAVASLETEQRDQLASSLNSMVALDTGTGLYNTMLDVYLHAQENYRGGVPTHAIVFTDGRNEFRPGTLTVEQLKEELAAARSPDRPVQLTVVAMGTEPDAELLADALEPVESYLAAINTAEEIRAVFIHLAAGGIHH